MRYVNAVVAVVVSTLVMWAVAVGAGPLPALGPTLQTAGGVWAWASGGKPVTSRTVDLPGMQAAARVTFDAVGVPTVHAASDDDLYLVQGYLHATFRLTQLDLSRRLARGRLAEMTGPSGVESDRWALQTGLLRTAEADWAAMPSDSPDARALVAYSRGVNARLAELRRDGDWPAMFTLTGLRPRDWTPVDTLSVQALLSQSMSWTSGPLSYAVLRSTLGSERTMAWFPVVPVNDQRPYDVGPYRRLPLDPLPANENANAAPPDAATPSGKADATPDPASTAPSTAAQASAARDLLSRESRLSPARTHTLPDSNAWAANGPAVAGSRAILAGDPHLQVSLPSYWYQITLSAPGTDVTGVSLVGLPAVVIGHNARIAWSLTNVQSQATMYYQERTSPDHPGQYYWRGAWRTMRQLTYSIPVRGGAPVRLNVDLTVHGPIMTQDGLTLSVTWMGNYVARPLRGLLALDRAGDFTQFRTALADWHAPAMNFAYADDQGHVGVVAAGYLPQVASGQPWLPLPGTGEADVAGVVPAAAAPQVYDPPNHVVVTSNQRPVGPDYPYYLGTSLNAFDYGYRAAQLYQELERHPGMTADTFRRLQLDVTDHLATLVVPRLRAALADAPLDATGRAALRQLDGWDYRMIDSSTGAALWWTFWTQYLSTVFQPWWDAAKVPVNLDQRGLAVSTGLPSLDQALERWTLTDPGNAAFTAPGSVRGTAQTAMRTAFEHTVAQLRGKLGADPASWRWSRLHTREIPSITGVAALGRPPRPAGGDPWTIDAADGGLNSSWGPSWRMVVDWTPTGAAAATALYPGGQSEHPASPWYDDLVPDWWDGRQRAMAPSASAERPLEWTLRPAGAPR